MQIEKNVPLPTKYPWEDLEVGDSVLIDEERVYNNARYSAYYHGKKTNKKFICRKEGTGGRVWRVE